MLWVDSEYRERIGRRCKENGRSVREVLKKVGCAHDYLQTEPKNGRRIDIVYRIGHEVGLTPSQTLGLRVSAEIELDILLIADRVTEEAMKLVQRPTRQMFLETLMIAYNILVFHRENGRDIADPPLEKEMTDFLRVEVRSRLKMMPRQ